MHSRIFFFFPRPIAITDCEQEGTFLVAPGMLLPPSGNIFVLHLPSKRLDQTGSFHPALRVRFMGARLTIPIPLNRALLSLPSLA